MAFKSLGPSTAAFPTPSWVIVTYDKNERANAMTAAWGGIVNSNPPSVAVAVQPGRYTYENILAKREFTVCIPSEEYAKETDYFGIVSGRDADKIAEAGLTAERAEKVNAPYIKEFPMHLECKLTDRMNLGSHFVLIGQIVDIKADETVLDHKDSIEIQKLKPMVYSPTDRSYYKVGDEIGKAFSIGREIKDKE
ncbi:Flavoredoxin [Methanimicrococcus sp. At1]|uniref:Flavoredoxin n=1 Tax=Methanimicrococcus hacksteinii TaxID=3028293 RepID=A0ABU3VPI4_9EURY|nr:flavin reductase family protein [Methanimicrococcus sp. At1]MDV0445318.1 Flavoredoxin [Methanimicrococcus sp. At1]